MMSCCGVISDQLNLLQKKSDNHLTTRRRRSTNEVCFCVSLKTHNPKLNLFIENQFFRSKSHRFITKATIKDNNLVEDSSSSLYQLLGISESGSFSEIKQAYKQLVRKYHPDVSPPDQTEEYTKRFIKVHEAYEILSDPNRRAMYDRDLAKGFHLAFSARKLYYHDEGRVDERSNWKNCWQTQLSGLKKKSMNRDSSNENMSWGARMRRQRNEHSEES